MGRYGHLSELAADVACLASEEAVVTGQTIVVDRGVPVPSAMSTRGGR
jgi:NAD(P)-dependent dehydrogenase (short-subunit alcohol dehydrogenase family)